jgi:hypothetical protein
MLSASVVEAQSPFGPLDSDRPHPTGSDSAKHLQFEYRFAYAVHLRKMGILFQRNHNPLHARRERFQCRRYRK